MRALLRISVPSRSESRVREARKRERARQRKKRKSPRGEGTTHHISSSRTKTKLVPTISRPAPRSNLLSHLISSFYCYCYCYYSYSYYYYLPSLTPLFTIIIIQTVIQGRSDHVLTLRLLLQLLCIPNLSVPIPSRPALLFPAHLINKTNKTSTNPSPFTVPRKPVIILPLPRLIVRGDARLKTSSACKEEAFRVYRIQQRCPVCRPSSHQVPLILPDLLRFSAGRLALTVTNTRY